MDMACFPADEPVKPEESYWWTVWSGGEAIAYAGLRVCQDPCNKGLGFLSRAGVLRAYRGQGLQKRLIRKRVTVARIMGLRELVTYVVPSNLASANSLIACGFKLYRPAYRWGGAGAMYFRREL